MTIPFWCLAAAAFIPYCIAISTAPFRKHQFGKLDNSNPRKQQRELEGTGARLVAAQANMWEALLVFAICVLIAHLSQADEDAAGIAAIVFICARIAHPIFYALNIGALRSISWAIGLLACVYLIYLSI